MQWYDDILEESDMLVSQGHGEAADDRSKDVKNLGCSIEFVEVVDQYSESLIHDPSDHFPSGDDPGVQLVKDILQVLSLGWDLAVEETKELLNEDGRDVWLQKHGINVSHSKC